MPFQDSPADAAAPLCLDQFLKLCGLVSTGGQAKLLIQSGEVKVNGVVETRRRKKLAASDVIELGSEKAAVRDFV
jgi:ribosome-associated protein